MTADDSPLVKLLGPSLLSKVGKKVSTADAFKGKELVLLYFSGELFKSRVTCFACYCSAAQSLMIYTSSSLQLLGVAPVWPFLLF